MTIPTHADCFYRIGASHKVCQDYALAGTTESGIVYAMVSDGCSSSPMTDVGARIVLHCTAAHMDALEAHHWRYTEPRSIYFGAIEAASAMSVNRTALDATRLVLVKPIGLNPLCQVLGDGYIINVSRDVVMVWGRKFDKNMPPYYRHCLSAADGEKYQRESTSSVTKVLRRSAGVWGNIDDDSIREPDRQIDPAYGAFEPGTYSLVTSDGIDSFVDAHGAPVPLTDVLDVLLDFKSFAGEFIQRRCKAFLDRACTERGWKRLDDFSLAGIYYGDEP